MRSIDAAVLTTDSVCFERIGDFQVHRDCGKKFADHQRFTLVTSIEVYFCDPQSPWQRGSKFEEGPVLADIVAKVENRTTLKISRKFIFGLLCCCVAFQRHYGDP
jgi:hypothetical protein